MDKKVLFIDTVHPALEETLLQHGFSCVHEYKASAKSLESTLDQYHGLVIRSRVPLNEDFLKHATQLEFIARAGAGMENIDSEYCLKKNIALFNAPEGNRDAVAEHAMGMILSLFNKLHLVDAEVRKGIWKRAENRGYELMGKTIGIIGFGNTGSAFARRLRGFHMNVLAYDKYKSNFGSEHVFEVDLNTILEQADIISLHIPASKETSQMVNKKFIASVKKPFYLINTARGASVDTQALLDGLNEGKVLGACLDVFDFEKSSFAGVKQKDPVLAELIKSEKVLLSPHIAGWTHESHQKLSEVLAAKILAHYKIGI